jgi:hypothetical protein
MRKLTLMIAAAAAYGLAPFTGRLGAIGGAAALVALGVLLAIAASGSIELVAAAGGAAGALAASLAAPTSAAFAGACLAGLAFGERSLRVRGSRARAAHVGVALVAGAIAGDLAARLSAAAAPQRAVGVLLGAVLLALPLLVEADDPIAHALEGLADDVGEGAGAPLRAGAELRRVIDADLLDRATARRVRATWRALLRLGETRARLARAERGRGAASSAAIVARLDQRLAEHVDVLRRAYLAVDCATAAEASVDDRALRTTEAHADSLEQQSRALVEEV